MSFLKWTRRSSPEGVEERPAISMSVFHVFGGIYYLLESRQVHHLATAFAWRKTPQGHSYWEGRCDGFVPMSEEDWAFCLELRDMLARSSS